MHRCLLLAQKGFGNTYPNPMVGAVVVKDGTIIGEGWHQKAGTAHAEVLALKNLDAHELASATLYVNLEPCSHYGKTPPCCDLVIAKGIKKVVIGAQDPNPKVAGKGIQALQEAGIEVIVGVLEEACKELNKRFYCHHIHKRPYIILKWAQSADGFIAPLHHTKGDVFWISDEHSQQLAHRWRAEEHAILVGRKTVEQDDPELTVRRWTGKHPIRLVIDPKDQIQDSYKVRNNAAPTVIFNCIKSEQKENIQWVRVKANDILKGVLEKSHERGIQSILVEGGAETISFFLKENLWDECRIFYGAKMLYEGVKAPTTPNGKSTEKKLVGDTLQFIHP